MLVGLWAFACSKSGRIIVISLPATFFQLAPNMDWEYPRFQFGGNRDVASSSVLLQKDMSEFSEFSSGFEESNNCFLLLDCLRVFFLLIVFFF